MEQGWLDLAGARWTVHADSSVEAFGLVPEPLRKTLAGVPATVPGVVHTDLLAAGLIDDPYVGTAEDDQHWIGQQTWTYRCEFHLDVGAPELTRQHTELLCDGLDTIAEVFCNGTSVGRSVNMHRRNAFALPNLRPGRNIIEITFAPVLEYAAEMAATVGERIHVERDPYNLVRKMACNFGWDWGPRLVTAGIWKAIGVRSWNRARIADLALFATAEETSSGSWTGHLKVSAQLAGYTRFGAMTVRVRRGEEYAEVVLPATEDFVEVDVTMNHVSPWWPHSVGAQPLYDVEVVLHDDEAILDTVSRRTGFRTVELDTTPDADGNGATFGFRVNGVQLFARGMDWIPDDCFPSRITAQRYRERVQQAVDAGVDMLRIWGGGIYEQAAFYDACDELGVMVWQDFCLACAAYPEEEPFATEVEAEARDNVRRLSPHPSLVLWNGNNECSWGFFDWDWEGKLDGKSWGAGYYYDLFPKIVAELDPTRPYWPGSPSSGFNEVHPNSPDYGCMHIWDVWNERDYTGYDDYSPRFVSEFGYQGPATWATWARTLEPADRSATSAAMLAHQKAAGGNTKLDKGIQGHLPIPGDGVDDFDEWLFAMQLQQARAVRYGIERWRSLRGRCLGSIVWQLNDCWPVTSWAALDLGTDAAGNAVARRKPLWYAVRSAYADRLVTLQHDADGWRAVLVNDGISDWVANGTVQLRRLSGEVLWTLSLSKLVPVRSKVDVSLTPDATDVPAADLALVVTLDGAERAVKLLAEDVDAHLPAAELEASVARTADGVAVTVTAGSFLRTLCLFADRVDEDAVTDRLGVDLFPGEQHTFTVAGTFADDDLAALTVRPALRSLTNPLTPSEAV
ncbi:MAG: glycoside hydrolase family 2 protein [Propionicimonas sp.]|uniref:glycoside hydrolase family 2 protein n=1 Tax=Propionicimonas sp. TaxID=1955623 RepID=UPI003D0EBA8B